MAHQIAEPTDIPVATAQTAHDTAFRQTWKDLPNPTPILRHWVWHDRHKKGLEIARDKGGLIAKCLIGPVDQKVFKEP